MKRLVEFPLDSGGSVLVEVDEPPRRPTMRGLGKDHSGLKEGAHETLMRPLRQLLPLHVS